jgi:hypothetical protein
MTRQEVVAALGPPDDVGGTSRKYRDPCVYKYGEVEVHFEQGRGGRLVLVYRETADGQCITYLNKRTNER